MIVELLADASIPLPVKRCAVPDKWLYAYGTRDVLHGERGLDKGSLVRMVVTWMQTELNSLGSVS